MNYLAHACLSFRNPGILTGNMISDFVKGKKKFEYPPAIRQGIDLHRSIDGFTDAHAETAKAKAIFKPVFRLYAGAFIDVVYDHFLATDHKEFETENALNEFAQFTYGQLELQKEFFPEKFRMMFAYMKTQNWLYHYRTHEGIRNSFGGLVRRAAYLNDAAPAFILFEEHYAQLQTCYRNFFPELKQFAKNIFQHLNHGSH